jgi:hypothetical protein
MKIYIIYVLIETAAIIRYNAEQKVSENVRSICSSYTYIHIYWNCTVTSGEASFREKSQLENTSRQPEGLTEYRESETA